MERSRSFLIKVSADSQPAINPQPMTPIDWEKQNFHTDQVRKTITRSNRKTRLPSWQTEAPQIGDHVYVWLNNSHGRVGGCLTARAEVGKVRNASGKLEIQVKNIRLIPEGIVDGSNVEHLSKPGNVFDDIHATRTSKLRYLSPEWAAQLDELIHKKRKIEFSEDANNEVKRLKRLAKMARRPQQKKFSEELRAAYEGKCAISGCHVGAALQAAHIQTSSGSDNNSITNGILLRADIHALFDAFLLTLSADGEKLQISPKLDDRSYRWLRNAKVRRPEHGKAPSKENIEAHRKLFLRQH